MAADNQNNKRGPGRPPGSKNKNKSGGNNSGSKSRSQSGVAASSEQAKIDKIRAMQEQYDRDRRNLDVIWSITLAALGIFLDRKSVV